MLDIDCFDMDECYYDEHVAVTRYRGDDRDVVIPYGVTCICESAFEDCETIRSVEIPDTVTVIEPYAFMNCTNLETVVIPDGVDTISYGAFAGCGRLESIDLPEGLVAIEDEAFSECRALLDIKIPSSVRNIGERAFQGCYSLTRINIPDGVTKIKAGTFCDCMLLSEINIPSSVTEVGDTAFRGCHSLTSIELPEGVRSIGNSALFGCYLLKSITFPSTIQYIDKELFGAGGLKVFHPHLLKVYIDDFSLLPLDLLKNSVEGFIRSRGDFDSEIGEKYMSCVGEHVDDFLTLAMKESSLLRAMCNRKMLSSQIAEHYIEFSRKNNLVENNMILTGYYIETTASDDESLAKELGIRDKSA